MKKQKENYINTIKEKFTSTNVLVIGDIMVDEYILGKVKRISPEAPIPILNYTEERKIAGGASNVAHNISSLGSNVMMAGVIGNDIEGIWLLDYLKGKNISIGGIVTEEGRSTIVKRRFATKSQQLLRVDIEECREIAIETENIILAYLKKHINKIDAVILSDYNKGVFTSGIFISKIIEICLINNVIVGIDSKRKNIEAFRDATFVKPNNLELEQAIGIRIKDDESLNKAGQIYLERSGVQTLLVTRGAKGISLFQKNMKRKDYPSKAAQVYDVTGAGDTVISIITLGIACGLSMEESIVLGNIAASVVINKVGTIPITSEELIGKLYEIENIK